MAVRKGSDPVWDYHDFRFFAAALVTKEAEDEFGSPITWLDLALNWVISLDRTMKGAGAGYRITSLEAEELIRKVCGEEAYQHLPPRSEITAAIRNQKLLRLAFGY